MDNDVVLHRDSRDLRPPNPPWCDLNANDTAGGFLSFYLSDDLSRYAVRGITLPANNKSDPNLETKTYGLFSICGHGMRASIVKRGCPVVIFMTRRGGQRVITGYYRIGWYAPGPLSTVPPDYALAAVDIRFVDPPLELADLPRAVRAVVSQKFRVFKRIDPKTVDALVRLFRRRRDRTADYLKEIIRLEKFNEYRTGYKYVNWRKKTPWTWEDAIPYLAAKPTAQPQGERRQSTNFWRCQQCKEVMFSKARLKRCPRCGAVDSLESVPPPADLGKIQNAD